MDLHTFGDSVDATRDGHEPRHAAEDAGHHEDDGGIDLPEVATVPDPEPVATVVPSVPVAPVLDDVLPGVPTVPPAPPGPPVHHDHRSGLPVPTVDASMGAHPVHMPLRASGPLELPDRRLLTPPAEPVWMDPFREPEPHVYRVGPFNIGASRHEFWDTKRRNHEHAMELQRTEYGNAMLDHDMAVEQVRSVMARAQRMLYEASRRAGAPRVFAPAHSKGGVGKTPSATAVAAVCGQATRQPVLLVDANPYRGGSASRSGVELGDVLTITEVMERHETMTMNDFLQRTNPTEYGVLTIASDPEAVREPDPDRFTAMIESLKRLSAIIVIDTGNHIVGELNRAIYRLASALMFPMLTVWGPQTTNGPVDDLLGTKHALELMANEDPRDACFAAKTRLGVTVALGLKPHESEDAFRHAAGADGMMLTVPWDDTAATPQPLVLPTKDGQLSPIPGVLDPFTAVAWMKVALACFDRAEEYDRLASRQA